MFVSVKEMLMADVFRDSEIVAGHAGADKTVTSIDIINGPLGYKYAERDTFVLCSAYSIAQDSGCQLEFIEQLAGRGAVGVAMKPQNFQGDAIPDVLKERADKLAFPLVALPNDSASYSEFFDFFSTNVFCRGPSEFRSKDLLLKDLLENLRSRKFPWLAQRLHELSGRDVSILFKNLHHTFPIDKKSYFAVRLSKDFKSHGIKLSSKFPGMLMLDGEGEGDDEKLCDRALGVAFRFESNAMGYIWLYGRDAAADSNDVALLECAKLACELEIHQVLAYRQQQECRRLRFLELLLAGRLAANESMLFSKALDWRLPLDVKVFVVTCNDAPQILLDMDRLVTDIFDKHHANGLVYPRHDELIVFLPHLDDLKTDFRGVILDALKQRFAPVRRFVAGTGRRVPLQDVRLSYEQAVCALHIGVVASPDELVHDFEKLGLFRLCCPAALPQETEKFCSDYLGALIRFDADAKLDLLKTLATYFACSENFSRTGNELFLHPNTIRYRMDVIEKVCEVNLGNPDDVLNLKVALKLLPLVPMLQSFSNALCPSDLSKKSNLVDA